MVIHGIPGDQVLQPGDLVSIDCGAIVDGWHGDAAFTTVVGEATDEQQRLLDAAWASLAAGVSAMQPGGHLTDIGAAVQACGRGCRLRRGARLLRARHRPGHARAARTCRTTAGPAAGPRLAPGVVLAVEPMLTAGRAEVDVVDDGWGVVSVDGSLTAHVEHTIAITDDGPEILTAP